MTDKPAPHFSPYAEAARLARLDREATALRENLRKRKAQTRARTEDTTPPAPAKPEPDVNP